MRCAVSVADVVTWMGDDREVLIQILELADQGIGEHREVMEGALQPGGSIEEAGNAAHRLANTCSVLREPTLFGVMNEIEANSKRGDTESVAALWEMCRAALEDLHNEVRQELQKNGRRSGI